MYYEEVFSELSRRQVKYLVVGGVALVLHGVLRLTADLDLMLDMGEENLAEFVAAMQALKFKPKMPGVSAGDFLDANKRAMWKREKNMLVFSFVQNKGYQLIDILLDFSIDFNLAAKRKKVVRAKGISIPIVGLDDLIQLKRNSGRPQDLADIAALEQLAISEHGR